MDPVPVKTELKATTASAADPSSKGRRRRKLVPDKECFVKLRKLDPGCLPPVAALLGDGKRDPLRIQPEQRQEEEEGEEENPLYKVEVSGLRPALTSVAYAKHTTCYFSWCRGPYSLTTTWHLLPKKPPALRQGWLDAMDLTEDKVQEMSTKSLKICSRHFAAEDFERDLRSELLYKKVRMKLSPSAVPAGRPAAVGAHLTVAKYEWKKRMERRQRQEMVEQLLRSADRKEEEQQEQEEEEGEAKTGASARKRVASAHKACQANVEDANVTAKINLLRKEVRRLKMALKREKERRARYETVSERDKMRYAREMILSRTPWSEAQTTMFLEGKKSVHWSEADRSVAVLVRNLTSRRVYRFFRDKRLIPLPSLSTLKRWPVKTGEAANDIGGGEGARESNDSSDGDDGDEDDENVARRPEARGNDQDGPVEPGVGAGEAPEEEAPVQYATASSDQPIFITRVLNSDSGPSGV